MVIILGSSYSPIIPLLQLGDPPKVRRIITVNLDALVDLARCRMQLRAPSEIPSIYMVWGGVFPLHEKELPRSTVPQQL